MVFIPSLASSSTAGDKPLTVPEDLIDEHDSAVDAISVGVIAAFTFAAVLATAPAASDSDTPRRRNRDRSNRRPRASRPWTCPTVESVCSAIARRDCPSK